MRLPSPPVVTIKQELMEMSDAREREGYAGLLSGGDILGGGQVDGQHAGDGSPLTAKTRLVRDKSKIKPVGSGAGEMSEASESSEASDNSEASTNSRESDDHEEKAFKGEADEITHAERASGREKVITDITKASSNPRHQGQTPVAVIRTPCPAPPTTVALRNSTNAHWSTPSGPEAEANAEALDGTPTSQIVTDPTLSLIGSPLREPVMIQHDGLPSPAYLLAARLSARSVLTHRTGYTARIAKRPHIQSPTQSLSLKS